MGNRVQSGAIDPVEYAVFLARLNKLQSTIFALEAKSKTIQKIVIHPQLRFGICVKMQ